MACCKDKKAIFSVRRRPIFSFTKNYATDFQAISRHTAFTSEPFLVACDYASNTRFGWNQYILSLILTLGEFITFRPDAVR